MSKKKGGKPTPEPTSPSRAGASRSRPSSLSSGSSSSPATPPNAQPEGSVCFSARQVGVTLPGGRVLFHDVNLNFNSGAKIGLLGLNGTGKSSLLQVLAGVSRLEHEGSVWRAPGFKFGYLAQEPQLESDLNVHDNIMLGLKYKTELMARFESVSRALGECDASQLESLLEEQAAVTSEVEVADCWNLKHTVEIAKRALRVPPDHSSVLKLSGGERRRVALCRLLLEAPHVLLLDEPTNHLDADSVAWLEGYLKSYKGTVVAVTHDRYFLDHVAGWILELDRGKAYPFAGNYSAWLRSKCDRLEVEKKHEKKKARAMEEELEWIRQGVKGRQSKSKARVQAYERMVEEQAKSKLTEKFLSGAIVIPPAPRLGDQVIRVEGLSKSFGDRVLMKDVSFDVPPGAIVGIIGGNGTGKSTLLKIIAGELTPDAGTIKIGKTVQIGMVSQTRSELVDNQRVIDVVGGGSDLISMGEYEMPIRQYLASFNLVGELQTKLVRSLSGGERNRVHLARVLKTGANVLMLDEPTNDLDVDTLRSLEEALADYTGCALIVSHDRYFLDRVVTHMLVFSGDGTVRWIEGGYAAYEEYVASTAGRSAT